MKSHFFLILPRTSEKGVNSLKIALRFAPAQITSAVEIRNIVTSLYDFEAIEILLFFFVFFSKFCYGCDESIWP